MSEELNELVINKCDDGYLKRLSEFITIEPYVYPDNLKHKAEFRCIISEEALQDENSDSLNMAIDYLKDSIGFKIYDSVLNHLIEESVNASEYDSEFLKHVEDSGIRYNSFTTKINGLGMLYVPLNAYTLYLDKEYIMDTDTKDEFTMKLSLGYELVKDQDYPIFFKYR